MVHITRIKRQKINFINSGPVDIIRYIHRPWVDEVKFLPFYTCDMNDGRNFFYICICNYGLKKFCKSYKTFYI